MTDMTGLCPRVVKSGTPQFATCSTLMFHTKVQKKKGQVIMDSYIFMKMVF